MTMPIGPPATPSLLCSLELIVSTEGSCCGLFPERGWPPIFPPLTHRLTLQIVSTEVTSEGEVCPVCVMPMTAPFSEAASGLGTRDTLMQTGRKRLTVKTCRKKRWHYDRSPIAKERGSKEKEQVAVHSALSLILTTSWLQSSPQEWLSCPLVDRISCWFSFFQLKTSQGTQVTRRESWLPFHFVKCLHLWIPQVTKHITKHETCTIPSFGCQPSFSTSSRILHWC